MSHLRSVLELEAEVEALRRRVAELQAGPRVPALGEGEEAHRLETVLNSISDGLVVMDREWRYIYVSETASRILPVRREDMLGRVVWDLFPYAVGTKFHEYYHLAVETGEVQQFEEFYPEPLNQWLECRCYPSKDGLTVYFRDVTERKRVEAEAAELKRRLDSALLAGEVATFEWDVREDRLWGDATFARMFGIRLDPSGAAPLARYVAVIHPDDRPRVEASVAHTVETGAPYESEYRVVKDGETRWVAARGVGERDATGQVVRFPGAIVDITARKHTEEALRASEERFRSIVDNMSEGLMLFDAEGNLTYQNPASLRIHGFGTGEGLIEHDDLAATWRAWDESGREIAFDEWPVSRVFRRERFQNQVLRVVRPETGREFHASYNGCPVYDAAGNLALGFITIRDISDQVRARKAMQRSERRLRTFFTSEMMGALYWNMDGEITDANDKFLRMVGFSREDITSGGVSWAGMTPPEYLADDERALEELRTKGVDTPYEKEFIRKDGTRVPILIGAAMLDDSRHEGVAFVLDITERKLAEKTLAASKALAEEANRQKDHFLAMLGHELRNPLAPIRNAAALLRRIAPPDPALQRVRDVIDRQVTHMTRLIDDLLDVSRIARGKITLRKEDFDFSEVVQAAVEDHRPLFDANGVHLAFLAPSGSLRAFGDSARVSQIVSNLVVNANKFTNRGGSVVVEVRAEGDRDVAIHVRDTGIGMDPATCASLFRPFTQADQSIARSAGGLGLGLALVKGLVELHGGSVSAFSAGLGEGSEFVVSMPILMRLPSTAGEAPREAPAVRPQRILIVEDNLDAADMLKSLLELSGHLVAVACTGARGLEAARVQKPEVVFCDIGLPGDVDGYAVARALRSDPELASAYLVAVTGYGQDEDKERARQAGFDRHLTKPVDPDAVNWLLAR